MFYARCLSPPQAFTCDKMGVLEARAAHLQLQKSASIKILTLRILALPVSGGGAPRCRRPPRGKGRATPRWPHAAVCHSRGLCAIRGRVAGPGVSDARGGFRYGMECGLWRCRAACPFALRHHAPAGLCGHGRSFRAVQRAVGHAGGGIPRRRRLWPQACAVGLACEVS